MENFPLVGLLILGYVMDYFPIIMIGLGVLMIGLGVLVVVLAFRTEKKTPKK